MACLGLIFFFWCSSPQVHAPASNYCQITRPITWSSKDTRLTKEQVDTHNRTWKRLCREIHTS